jgi:uncharacterized Zn finger protein
MSYQYGSPCPHCGNTETVIEVVKQAQRVVIEDGKPAHVEELDVPETTETHCGECEAVLSVR